MQKMHEEMKAEMRAMHHAALEHRRVSDVQMRETRQLIDRLSQTIMAVTTNAELRAPSGQNTQFQPELLRLLP